MSKSSKTTPPLPVSKTGKTVPPMGTGTKAKTVAPFPPGVTSRTVPPMPIEGEGVEIPVPPPEEKIMVVRYSLPELLAEIRLERAASTMAMEKLHQAEITKLFSSKPKVRRGKAKSG